MMGSIGMNFTNGRPRNTKLVKDITPGFYCSHVYGLMNVNRQLYFVKDDVLWKSDATETNTNPAVDGGLNRLSWLPKMYKNIPGYKRFSYDNC